MARPALYDTRALTQPAKRSRRWPSLSPKAFWDDHPAPYNDAWCEVHADEEGARARGPEFAAERLLLSLSLSPWQWAQLSRRRGFEFVQARPRFGSIR